VPAPELHLKSIITALDADTVLLADNPAGRELLPLLNRHVKNIVLVPDAITANILRLKPNFIVMQAGFPKSKEIILHACQDRGLNLIELNMSELVKLDGALTCCSLLVDEL